MNKLNIYEAAIPGEDFHQTFLVYADSEQTALRLAWKADGKYCDYNKIRQYIKLQICSYADKLQFAVEGHSKPFVICTESREISEILRAEGWRMEDEISCECCGLYPYGMDKYKLDKNELCPECKAEENNE